MGDGIVGLFSSGEQRPKLNDPRVAESWGGGWAPEQHTGTLTDGRRFYFRTRHGNAQLHVNTVEECEADEERKRSDPTVHYLDLRDEVNYPPIPNPEFDSAEHEVAYRNGETYDVPFWAGEYASEDLPDEEDYGRFSTQERRDASFKRLLDRIEAARGRVE